MHYKVLEDVIDRTIIDEIVDFFNNYTHLHENKMYMVKINNPWDYPVVNQLSDLISDYVDVTKNIGDNVYKHDYPYYPHIDIDDKYPSVNFLIPLYVENQLPQHFVIFDQYVDENIPKTWLGNATIDGDFVRNKKQKFIYTDPTVKNLTNDEIDENFYISYLDQEYRDRDLFRGCSGVAVDFKPGNAIMFDSKHIHCTGKMLARYKMGLSLRFQGYIK